jgi:hypothetical protein
MRIARSISAVLCGVTIALALCLSSVPLIGQGTATFIVEKTLEAKSLSGVGPLGRIA